MRLQNLNRRRGSVRSRVTAELMSVTIRPLTGLMPLNRAGVTASRRGAALFLSVVGPPVRGSRINHVGHSNTRLPDVRGEWVRGPKAVRDDAVILYIHGSGYAICSARTHRGITTRLSAMTGLPVFACDYRLAPRHRFPSAADDVRAAYEWLLSEGHDPANVVVAGDSAGGHLAVDLTIQLIREGRTPPAALVLFSPVLDVTVQLAAKRDRLRPDPMVSAPRAAKLLGLYASDVGFSPRLAFSFGDVHGFPPTLVHAGEREMLAADAVELTRLLRGAGVRCDLELWPDQVHVFQALNRIVPEAHEALTQASEFITTQVDARRRRADFALLKQA